MSVFSLISSLLAAASVTALCGISQSDLTDLIMTLLTGRSTFFGKSMKRKKRRRSPGASLAGKLEEAKAALEAAGRGKLFAPVITASVLLSFGGIVISFLTDNIFLAPPSCIILASLPLLYIRHMISAYEKETKNELESALSVITNSYIRSDDIVSSVRENLRYLKEPLKSYFTEFVGEASVIKSDVRDALRRLGTRVDNEIFSEWTDTLVQCQNDRTLKDTLPGVISRLTDVRLINSEISVMRRSARNEYFAMAALVVGNVPLLYFLNRDWFSALIYSLPGKITCGIVMCSLLICTALAFRFTRQIEYRK